VLASAVLRRAAASDRPLVALLVLPLLAHFRAAATEDVPLLRRLLERKQDPTVLLQLVQAANQLAFVRWEALLWETLRESPVPPKLLRGVLQVCCT
jgi:hypothetical protein